MILTLQIETLCQYLLFNITISIKYCRELDTSGPRCMPSIPRSKVVVPIAAARVGDASISRYLGRGEMVKHSRQRLVLLIKNELTEQVGDRAGDVTYLPTYILRRLAISPPTRLHLPLSSFVTRTDGCLFFFAPHANNDAVSRSKTAALARLVAQVGLTHCDSQLCRMEGLSYAVWFEKCQTLQTVSGSIIHM